MDKAAKQKKEKRVLKRRQEERLTNWYMINMCWSIFGIVALFIIQRVYAAASVNAARLTAYEITMWSIAGAALIGAVVLLVLGAKGVIKNKSRAKNYSIFLFIVAGSSAFVVAWRVYIRSLVAMLFGTSNFLYMGSYWGIWLLMLACVAWIVVAFVIYLIRLSKIKKGQK